LLACRRRARHAVELDEVFACHRDQLGFGRPVHGFVADDLPQHGRAVFFGVMLEVDLRSVRPGDQHLLDAGQRVADLAEELMLAAHLAAMLLGVVAMGLDLLRLHMLGVELQHLGALVIDPDNGVE
jgi:hypothetical protein